MKKKMIKKKIIFRIKYIFKKYKKRFSIFLHHWGIPEICRGGESHKRNFFFKLNMKDRILNYYIEKILFKCIIKKTF